ncbi:uncharacterized protein LOC125372770 [Haliotis rufescens]|uniref:uncharacterized protein LOC125372770 n=1 Tax=Haliotis rufescens TaxID=6454 RepID=UPI00201F2CEC|nr:uncharacterized protein LOC125372770 [Haliotis rufescens]
METVSVFGLLVLLANSCLCSIICDKVDVAEIEGDVNSVCYNQGSEEIKCPRNESVLVKHFLQRAHVSRDGDDRNADYRSCVEKFNDEYYDVGECLLMTSEVHQKRAYQAAITEVLEECSQKRYCILESDTSSSIHGLKDLPVGERKKRPSHLVVLHQCVKDQVASVLLCDSQTETGKEVYISSDRLKMSSLETNTCTCTVSGAASRVTLLDVRLDNSHVTTLSIRDKTRTVYTIHGGDQAVHFMKEINISQSEWSLQVDVIRDYLPDKIWMRLEGHNGSDVTVTCKESETHDTHVAPRSSSGERHTQIVFVCVGFVTGFVSVGFIMAICVKRRSGHSGSTSNEGGDRDKGVVYYSQPDESRVQQPIGSPEGDAAEPNYHMPDDPRDQGAAGCNYYLVPVHRQKR